MAYKIVAHQNNEVFAIVDASAVRADGSIDMTTLARVVHNNGEMSEPMSSLNSLIARGYWEDYDGPQGFLSISPDVGFEPLLRNQSGFGRKRRSL